MNAESLLFEPHGDLVYDLCLTETSATRETIKDLKMHLRIDVGLYLIMPIGPCASVSDTFQLLVMYQSDSFLKSAMVM